MHAWVSCLTQALTRTVAGFTKSRLIFFRASFTYKLCDTNSSDLSVWPSFAPFCICTTVPNGLPVLAFADSKRSHCKWIPNDSKPFLNWFGGMPSASIFSTILPQKLESDWTGKVALLVLKKQSHGHVRQILHWGPLSPLIVSGFGSRLVFRIIIIIENRFNWREVVPGNVSLPVVERWPWGARQITRCAVVERNVGSIALEVIGVCTVGMVVLSWRNLRAFAGGNSKANRDF